MDELKNLSLDDLMDKLIDCGREKEKYEDSERFYRIHVIKEEITRRFYIGEKFTNHLTESKNISKVDIV
jgi:hypothetical protein